MVFHAEDEYVLTRKRLDALGYKNPLGIDTLPLVHQLLTDLITTTSSLKDHKLQKIAENNCNKIDKIDSILAPFKADNARLLRENNDLSSKLINIKDEHSKNLRTIKNKSRKLQNENIDLIRLNETYVKAAQNLEKVSKNKENIIRRFQESGLQTVVEMPKNDNKRIEIPKKSIRRQRFNLDSNLKPGTIIQNFNGNLTSSINTSEIKNVDLMRLADKKIHQLTLELGNSKLKLTNFQNIQQEYQEKLFLRETEIARLRKELMGGRPEDVVTIEARCLASDKLIDQLNAQLELNQKASTDLEAVIDQERDNFRNLNAAHQEHLLELEAANDKIERLTLQLTNSGQDKMIAKGYSSKLKEDTLALEQQIIELKRNNERLNELCNSLKSQNGVLTSQLKMTQNSQNLNDSFHYSQQNGKRVSNLLKTLESERDYYKKQVTKLQNFIQKSNNEPSKQKTPEKIDDPIPNISTPNFSDPMKKSDEVLALVKQRDSLQLALEQFELHMNEIQTNVRILTKERDSAIQEEFNIRQELDKLRSSIVQDNENNVGIRNEADVSSSEIVFNKVLKERDLAVEECRGLKNERDVLQERYNSFEKRHLNEKSKLEQNLEDANAKLQAVIADSNNYESKVESLSIEKDSLQTRVRQLENSLDNTDKHTLNLNNQIENFKLNIVELEQRLLEHKQKSDHMTLERDQAINEKKRLDHEYSSAQSKIIKLEQINKKTKTGMVALDRDKDALQTMLDSKTEALYNVEKQLRKNEQKLRETEENNDHAQSYTERMTEEVSNYQREISSLKRKLDSLQRDFDIEARSKSDANKNLDQIRQDLIRNETEKRQLQINFDDISSKLVQNNSEIERLNLLINSYQSKQESDFEDNKAWKNRCDLIDEERQKTVKELSVSRDKLILMEQQLRNVTTELNGFQETNKMHLTEIQQHLKTMAEYEARNNSLNLALSEAKSNVSELENKLKISCQDVEQFREFNARLQNEVDQRGEANNEFQMNSEKIVQDYNDLKSSYERINHELVAEQAHARELELLVQKCRHKEFEIQLDTAHLKEELQHQKDNFEHTGGQVKIYEKQISEQLHRIEEMNTENEKIKRLLVHERYERERVSQLLKQTKEQFNM